MVRRLATPLLLLVVPWGRWGPTVRASEPLPSLLTCVSGWLPLGIASIGRFVPRRARLGNAGGRHSGRTGTAPGLRPEVLKGVEGRGGGRPHHDTMTAAQHPIAPPHQDGPIRNRRGRPQKV